VSDLSEARQEAYKEDREDYKLSLESYKIKDRDYRDQRANIATMIRHLNTTVSSHLQVSCFKEHRTLRS
jgi:hypothetical protein